jgi:hypothetical protein
MVTVADATAAGESGARASVVERSAIAETDRAHDIEDPVREER